MNDTPRTDEFKAIVREWPNNCQHPEMCLLSETCVPCAICPNAKPPHMKACGYCGGAGQYMDSEGMPRMCDECYPPTMQEMAEALDVLKAISVADWKTAGELRKMARDAYSSANAKSDGSP